MYTTQIYVCLPPSACFPGLSMGQQTEALITNEGLRGKREYDLQPCGWTAERTAKIMHNASTPSLLCKIVNTLCINA